MAGTEPLCGWEWLKKHGKDVTQDAWDKQGIEIIVEGKHKTTLKAKVSEKASSKEIKYVINQAIKK